MNHELRVEFWGDYACFTRSEMKVERVSYEVMTPSAARNMLQAIFWHPGFNYVIDEIDIMHPIRMTNIRRNEMGAKITMNGSLTKAKNGEEMNLSPKENIQQRASLILKDVRYVVHFHLTMTKDAHEKDNIVKFTEMLKRRASKGQCFTQPYLGCREFAAGFRLVGEEETPVPYPETKDLGFMLYDMDYTNKEKITPQFFHAKLDRGRMNVRGAEVYR